MRRTLTTVVVAVTAAALAPLSSASAVGHPSSGQDRQRVEASSRLRDAVTVDRILAHQRAFQAIADGNDGNRAAGTRGYAESSEYVESVLRTAGYAVQRQPFTVPHFEQQGEAEVAQVSPTAETYATTTVLFSGAGDVTGQLVPAGGIQVPAPAEPGVTSGCTSDDFSPASTAAPQVALIQRGTCSFEDKVHNAQAAGYDGAVIFNEGQPGREGTFYGTLAEPAGIPVVTLSYADGASLYEAAVAGGAVLRVATHVTNTTATTWNLVAQTGGGDPHRVVLVGAHLDSVPDGPGINDNGSGVSTVLVTAQQLAAQHLHPRNTIRFVFFGAEEGLSYRADGQSIGLLGSDHYVTTLTRTQRADIMANLNYDMLASPNYVRFVFDGDASSTGVPMPRGSELIEQMFLDYFASRGLATEPIEPTTWDQGEDLGPLVGAGIPTGGLFAGDDRPKTGAQAATYGGTAGESYDACYHLDCDTYANQSRAALDELGDAAAHMVWTLGELRGDLP